MHFKEPHSDTTAVKNSLRPNQKRSPGDSPSTPLLAHGRPISHERTEPLSTITCAERGMKRECAQSVFSLAFGVPRATCRSRPLPHLVSCEPAWCVYCCQGTLRTGLGVGDFLTHRPRGPKKCETAVAVEKQRRATQRPVAKL